MAMRQNLTNDFYGNIFLIPLSIKCQWLVLNSNAKSTKMAKIEVASSQLSVCLKQFCCVS